MNIAGQLVQDPITRNLLEIRCIFRNDGSSVHETRSLGGNIYATLPKSLKSELVVRSRVEDPEVQEERKKLTESKSVSELAAITKLSEFPLPANIEKLIGKATATTTADKHDRYVYTLQHTHRIYKVLLDLLLQRVPT